ncbi:hypothetical protein GGH12_002759 [Coemansia sp. RSA 1822]|nr:hypothetical protein LPJ76_002206 [Coemansia sp. RSA 638]KAJ2121981.1 hypothetical protein IW147_003784 [Coemansia sp. RSA 720]KAJ2538976.1 hypothetical protein GGF49_005550 [Coemansia sp. RSA 1853]KAJ2563157.1 hypothetical protein GGH12_002759 [Coemansia sp. RSA 1822]
MISGGGIAGVVVGIFVGCLIVIGSITLITIKVRRSIEATRQSAIQAAIDESEEVDGFQIIVVNEKRSMETGSLAATRKRSMDTGSLASTISEISAFEKPETAPKAGTTPA